MTKEYDGLEKIHSEQQTVSDPVEAVVSAATKKLKAQEFEKVTTDKIGTLLKDGETYLCKSGNDVFAARFNYCPEEFWWTDTTTEKLTGATWFKRKAH